MISLIVGFAFGCPLAPCRVLIPGAALRSSKNDSHSLKRRSLPGAPVGYENAVWIAGLAGTRRKGIASSFTVCREDRRRCGHDYVIDIMKRFDRLGGYQKNKNAGYGLPWN